MGIVSSITSQCGDVILARTIGAELLFFFFIRTRGIKMEQVSTLAADPGPPPRRIGIGELFKRLPAFLQIGTVVTPVCALIAIVWITIDQSKEAFRVTLVGIWVLPLAYCWALMYRWRFVNYTPIRGNISRFAQGTVGMSGATIVHYRYDVGSVPLAG